MNIKMLAATAALAIAAPAFAATNLLTNGSFEAGTAGWTPSGDLGFFSVVSSPCQDGSLCISDGAVGDFSFLSQTVSTIVGATYTVSGWGKVNNNEFGFGINGGNQVDVGPNGDVYTNYTFSFVGTGSDTLTIFNRNDPAFNQYDNFSISADVPEPATWAMMIGGFAMTGFAMRRRKVALAA